MGEQLSLKAAMPLAEILATCRKNFSNTGPRTGAGTNLTFCFEIRAEAAHSWIDEHVHGINGHSESQENTPFSRRDFVTYMGTPNNEIALSYFLCLCEIVLMNTAICTCSEWIIIYCNFCLENSEFFQEPTATKFTMVILKDAQLIMFRIINV